MMLLKILTAKDAADGKLKPVALPELRKRAPNQHVHLLLDVPPLNEALRDDAKLSEALEDYPHEDGCRTLLYHQIRTIDKNAAISWVWGDTPLDDIKEKGALLVSCDADSRLLVLFEKAWSRYGGAVWIRSDKTADEVLAHLRAIQTIYLPNGGAGSFRLQETMALSSVIRSLAQDRAALLTGALQEMIWREPFGATYFWWHYDANATPPENKNGAENNFMGYPVAARSVGDAALGVPPQPQAPAKKTWWGKTITPAKNGADNAAPSDKAKDANGEKLPDGIFRLPIDPDPNLPPPFQFTQFELDALEANLNARQLHAQATITAQANSSNVIANVGDGLARPAAANATSPFAPSAAVPDAAIKLTQTWINELRGCGFTERSDINEGLDVLRHPQYTANQDKILPVLKDKTLEISDRLFNANDLLNSEG